MKEKMPGKNLKNFRLIILNKMRKSILCGLCTSICGVWLMLCAVGCRTQSEWLDVSDVRASGSMMLCDTVKFDDSMILIGKNNQMFILLDVDRAKINNNVTEKDLLKLDGAGLFVWDGYNPLLALKPAAYSRVVLGDMVFPEPLSSTPEFEYLPFTKNFRIVRPDNRPDYLLKFLIRGNSYNCLTCMEPLVQYDHKLTKEELKEKESRRVYPVDFQDPFAYYILYLPVWERQK